MIKKVILGLVVIVAIFGIGYAAFTNMNTTTSPTNNSSVQNVQNTTSNTSNAQKTENKTISSEEAKKIATKYIEVAGATTGTPKLVNQDNRMVYIVPVMVNGKNVGEIDIDAQTGANLGGAGGG
ncbi:MAG: PepSY domain-containing protein [Methanobacterium sp. ERen5]|nr:MAG: PepSY domain-containing protein [Methanobacterium sp. ERen5]